MTGLRTPSSPPPSDIPVLVFSQKRLGLLLGILFLSVMTLMLLLLACELGFLHLFLISSLVSLGAYGGLPLLLLLVESYSNDLLVRAEAREPGEWV